MTITSFYFLAFVFIGLAVYYLLPPKWQWIELLCLSIIFYCFAGTPYTYVYICISSLSAYVTTSVFSKYKDDEKSKKTAIVICLCINIALWFVLKAGALWEPLVRFIFPGFSSEAIGLISSLGMGYYTLQLLGYVIDCYWNNIEPLHNPFKVLLITSFFPQMVTGPISKYNQLKTLFEEHRFDYTKISFGAQRILWGFFKKLVISEKLAAFPSTIVDNIWYYNGFYTWIAVLVFPLQIYTDFSGCTDIAIGVAELFGVKLDENFNNPLFSRSSQEFWQRWHITLGGWAKDYVFYPLLASRMMVGLGKKLRKKLGKKRGKFIVTAIGMFVLWMVMGIWHGSYRHILGVSLWYWTILMLGELFNDKLEALNKKLQIKTESFSWHLFQRMRTYLIFSIGSTFFCYGLSKALLLLSQCANVILKKRLNPWIFFDGSLANFISYEEMNIIIVGIILLVIVAILREKYGYARIWISKQGFMFRWVIWISLFVITLIYGNYGPEFDESIFIYQGF